MHALLHDADEQCWYEYSDLQQILYAECLNDVLDVVAQAETFANQVGGYAVGYISYDAAPAFDVHLNVRMPEGIDSDIPFLVFGLFGQRTKTVPATGFHMDAQQANTYAWSIDMSPAEYRVALQMLAGGIENGDFYQVNFSARCRAQNVSGWHLFQHMGVDALYGAYLRFALPANYVNDSVELVSASPELFFKREQDYLESRPMKGTAARSLQVDLDQQNYAWLAASEKNRAENLMITDMVRNDLGRIARTGSVGVRDLFAIEAHPSIWQMTSTVYARSNADMQTVLTALFPPASITGAPKQASMNFIAANEKSSRGIYTGAIGVLGPHNSAVFSVAIRTACVLHERSSIPATDSIQHIGFGEASYGVGGGIVADSTVGEEYGELLAKTQILSNQTKRFELLETMRLDEGEVYLLSSHLERLGGSAEYYGFALNRNVVEAALKALASQYPQGTYRVRLLIDRLGGVEIECQPIQLEPASFADMGGTRASQNVQTIVFARTQVDAGDKNLRHKTTLRSIYEQAAAEYPQHEVVLSNRQGFVTESAIANIVYEMNGRLFTPRLNDGLLPGTLRGVLLKEGKIFERSLHVDELLAVEDWFLISALRGWRRAHFVETGNPS